MMGFGNLASCSHPRQAALVCHNPDGPAPEGRPTTFFAVCQLCGRETDEYASRDEALEALANLPRN